MTRRAIFVRSLEILAIEPIERYPTGYLSETEAVWPCATAIRIPDGSRPNTLRAVIRDLDQEVRAFGTACQWAKGACIPFSFPVSATATAEAI